MDIITFLAFYLNPFLQRNNQPAVNRYILSDFSHYNLGGNTIQRATSNYKITKRKDGRYYIRLQDGGDITHIYGKTKAEVKTKLEIKIEELNTLDRRRTEQTFPIRNITLANWAHLCLNTFCAFSSIRGSFYATYAGNVLFLLKKRVQCDILHKKPMYGKIVPNLMWYRHKSLCYFMVKWRKNGVNSKVPKAENPCK